MANQESRSPYPWNAFWEMRLPAIRFGRNSIDVTPQHADSLCIAPGDHGLIVTDKTIAQLGHASRVRSTFESEGFDVTVYDGVDREPSIKQINRFFQSDWDANFDFVIGLGGGSCLDVAKVVRMALTNRAEIQTFLDKPWGKGKSPTKGKIPLLLVPTTGGTPAQISPIAVLTNGSEKVTITDPTIRGDAVIQDPTLSLTLPADLTAATAMDAIAGAIEGYTTNRYYTRPNSSGDPALYRGQTLLTDMLSERCLTLMANNLGKAVHNGKDIKARENVMLGSLFGSIAGQAAGVHLCHAMSYAVAKRYQTYHSETVGVLLPVSSLGYNAPASSERVLRIENLLDNTNQSTGNRMDIWSEASQALIQLQRDLTVFPSGLSELIGLQPDDERELAKLAELTMNQERLLANNPRSVDEDDVALLFRHAIYNWNEDEHPNR